MQDLVKKENIIRYHPKYRIRTSSLRNVDYKTFAHILVNQIFGVISELVREHQNYGIIVEVLKLLSILSVR